MAVDNKKKDKEREAIDKINEYRIISETNIVSILWKNPDLFLIYDEITLNTFKNNKCKVFYQIGYDIVVKEKKILEPITIAMYLEKHPKLAEKYDKYGGYDIISTCEYVEESNMDGYIEEINKWNVLDKLYTEKFPIADRLNEYIDMSCEEIYDEKEALLNHIFVNASGKERSYKIGYGIEDLIDELDEGMAVGLPLYSVPMLTNEVSGNLTGNITLMGGLSGSGKTTFTRNTIIPSILDNDEKICIMVNEEGVKKWQRELIIWVANNIFDKDIQKYKLRNGKFDPKFKEWLKNAPCKWIKEREDQIIITPFSQYSTSKAIKTIKKFAHLGFKYFILDTYKADSNVGGNDTNFWMSMQQNMVNIYDTIKEESLNVHIWITFQLSKSSSRQRCYTQDNIGMAKNIIDVASTCIMVRNVYEDEYPGEKNELKVYNLGGKNKKTKIPVTLDKDKHYQVLFIVKNREGSSSDYSIVVEHDLSKNKINEVGLTIISPDF